MGIRVLLCCFLLQNTDYKNSTLKVIKTIFACVNIHFLV
mgnify:FL=1